MSVIIIVLFSSLVTFLTPKTTEKNIQIIHQGRIEVTCVNSIIVLETLTWVFWNVQDRQQISLWYSNFCLLYRKTVVVFARLSLRLGEVSSPSRSRSRLMANVNRCSLCALDTEGPLARIFLSCFFIARLGNISPNVGFLLGFSYLLFQMFYKCLIIVGVLDPYLGYDSRN